VAERRRLNRTLERGGSSGSPVSGTLLIHSDSAFAGGASHSHRRLNRSHRYETEFIGSGPNDPQENRNSNRPASDTGTASFNRLFSGAINAFATHQV